MNFRKIVVAGFLTVLGASTPAALARTNAAAQEQKAWPTPDEVVAKMSTKLSLTDDQKTKIKPIIADRQEKLKALAADTSTPRLQKARKMKTIFDDSDTKINALLTDDQKKKYAEMSEEMRQEDRERREQFCIAEAWRNEPGALPANAIKPRAEEWVSG